MNKKKGISLGKLLKIHLGYLFFRLGIFLVRRMAITSLSSYGEKLGSLSFYLLRRWRRVGLNNLNLVFGKEKGKDEILRIRREVFKNVGRDMLEISRCVDFQDSYFKALVRFEGKEHLDRALKQGKGAIVLSAHLGNFALMGARLANEGYPLSLVAQDPANPKIARDITALRDSVGMESIPAEPRTACVARCFKALKGNRLLMLLIDQNAPVTEAWVDFFGYLVPTFKGPVLLSLRTGAPILPMFITRGSNHSHTITVHPPFELKTSKNVDQDITSNLGQLTKIIEAAIRESPEQWLWVYRRFKKARDIKTGERLLPRHP